MEIQMKLPGDVEVKSTANRESSKYVLLIFKEEESLIKFIRRLLDYYYEEVRRLDNPLLLFDVVDRIIDFLGCEQKKIADWKSNSMEARNMRDTLERLVVISNRLLENLS